MTTNTFAQRLFLSFVMLTLVNACSKGTQELRMAEPRLEFDRAIAAEFAELMNEQSSIKVTLVPTAEAGLSGIDALLSDQADIALVSNNEKFTSEVAAVMPMYANVLHILIDEKLLSETPAQKPDLAQLFTNSTIFAGPAGSPSRVMLGKFMSREEIDAGDIHFTDSLSDGCPDVFVIFAPILRDLSARLNQCENRARYVLYSMGAPEDLGKGSAVEASTLIYPSLRIFVIPQYLYGKNVSPTAVVTLAVDKMLVARPDVRDAVIYDLMSEVMRLRPALSAREPTLFHGIADDFDSIESTFILHAGAQAYIDRNEPSVYERYSGVAEVAVSVFFALLSGSIAAARIYSIRRKNRIDTFYAEAIRLRNSISESSTTEQRNQVIKGIRTLESRAFELLVGEKLAANDSFRIFMALANDIIAEMKESRGGN